VILGWSGDFLFFFSCRNRKLFFPVGLEYTVAYYMHWYLSKRPKSKRSILGPRPEAALLARNHKVPDFLRGFYLRPYKVGCFCKSLGFLESQP